jgi:hypothetical protein
VPGGSALPSVPPIGPLEHDLAGVVFQAGALQQVRQGHARPFGVADGAQLPLCPRDLWDEKDSTVPCALQRGVPRLGRQVAQLLVAQRKGIPDGAADVQPVRVDLEPRRGEMTADVEQLGRRQVRVHLVEGSLQVDRLLLSNDQAGCPSFNCFRHGRPPNR